MPRLVTGAAALDLYQYVALWLLPRELVAWEAPYAAPRREPYRHEWLSVDSQSYRRGRSIHFGLSLSRASNIGLQKDGPERPIGVITAITKMRLPNRLKTFSFHATFTQIWSPYPLGMRSERTLDSIWRNLHDENQIDVENNLSRNCCCCSTSALHQNQGGRQERC